MHSTASTFTDWWNTEGEWVEAPNERRQGSSGVQFLPANQAKTANLYCKRQINHCYRSLRHPLGRPTVFREQQAIRALNALGISTPIIVYCGAEKHSDHWRALLVTEELAGYVSLEDWYASAETSDPALTNNLLNAIAKTLTTMHQAGWQHSCCYAKHIFVRTNRETQQAEVALLDLEKARRRWPARSAALHDLAQLSRHKDGMPDTDWRALLDAYSQLNPALATALQGY